MAASTNPATLPGESQDAASPARLAFKAATKISEVNSPSIEGASCMSPAGDFLYFTSNRPGGFGKFDIYRSRFVDGAFGAPENLGPSINTSDNEADPDLALNGYRLYFSSDRPGAGGRYHLLVAESHEVFSELHAHAPPKVGTSAWVMLLSALVLVPLLMMLRGWESRRLDLLQRCLLISLLLHVIVVFAMSFVAVTKQVSSYVKRELAVEIAVKLPNDVAEAMAIRSQAAGSAPVVQAAPVALPQTQVPVEALEAPPSLQVGVPQAHAAPGDLTIEVAAPPAPAVPIAPPPVVAAVPAMPAEVLDLHVAPPKAVSQAEVSPPASAVERVADKASESPIAAAPVQVSVQTPNVPLPTDAPLISPPEARAPVAAPAEVARPDVAPAAGPAISAPQAVAPVASFVDRSPSLSESQPALERRAVALAPSPAAPDLAQDLPREQALPRSSIQAPEPIAHGLSDASPPPPEATPVAIEDVKVQVAATVALQRADEPSAAATLRETAHPAGKLAEAAPDSTGGALDPTFRKTSLSAANVPAATPSTRPADDPGVEPRKIDAIAAGVTPFVAKAGDLDRPIEGPRVAVAALTEPVRSPDEQMPRAGDRLKPMGPASRPAALTSAEAGAASGSAADAAPVRPSSAPLASAGIETRPALGRSPIGPRWPIHMSWRWPSHRKQAAAWSGKRLPEPRKPHRPREASSRWCRSIWTWSPPAPALPPQMAWAAVSRSRRHSKLWRRVESTRRRGCRQGDTVGVATASAVALTPSPLDGPSVGIPPSQRSPAAIAAPRRRWGQEQTRWHLSPAGPMGRRMHRLLPR